MGVTKKPNGKFRARYTLNGERHNVGVFDTELKAKRALNKHRRNEIEKYAFLGTPLKDHELDFKDIPDLEPKDRPFKPSLINRIKTQIQKGQEWLKKQLDN